MKTLFILVYQKWDLEYKRKMNCELRFKYKIELDEFLENLKKDRNLISYTLISKETFEKDKDF